MCQNCVPTRDEGRLGGPGGQVEVLLLRLRMPESGRSVRCFRGVQMPAALVPQSHGRTLLPASPFVVLALSMHLDRDSSPKGTQSADPVRLTNMAASRILGSCTELRGLKKMALDRVGSALQTIRVLAKPALTRFLRPQKRPFPLAKHRLAVRQSTSAAVTQGSLRELLESALALISLVAISLASLLRLKSKRGLICSCCGLTADRCPFSLLGFVRRRL